LEKNAIETEEIPSEIFAASCPDNRLASYYVETMGPNCRYLCAFHEGTQVGYAIFKDNNQRELVQCLLLFVKEEFRRRGIAARLLAEVEALSRAGEKKGVRFCLFGEAENFFFLKDFLGKRGYGLEDRLFIFWCDGYGDPGYVGWERYMERRGESLVRWLEDDGFSVVALEDAGGDVMTAIRELGAADPGLDVLDFLTGRQGHLSRRISCITLKDGRPVALCIANEPDEISIVFERIGVAAEYKNTGAILPAISASIRRCKKYGYQRILYSIYESNTSALAFARRVLSNVTSNTKVQYNYLKKTGALPEGR
jgi:GNAT superfamily N-acetyltransferase